MEMEEEMREERRRRSPMAGDKMSSRPVSVRPDSGSRDKRARSRPMAAGAGVIVAVVRRAGARTGLWGTRRGGLGMVGFVS